MRAVSITALLVFSATAFAQSGNITAPKDKDLWVSQADMDALMAKAKDKTTGQPVAFSTRLFDAGNASTAFIRLMKPDQPHAHADWSEVFVVKEGEGVLQTGGTIVCPCGNDSAVHKDIFTQAPAAHTGPPRNPLDKSGTSIEGGVKQRVKAGDMVLVPSGVAHTWVEVDKPVVYLDIKFPKTPETN